MSLTVRTVVCSWYGLQRRGRAPASQSVACCGDGTNGPDERRSAKHRDDDALAAVGADAADDLPHVPMLSVSRLGANIASSKLRAAR